MRAVEATSAWIARSERISRLPTGEVRTFAHAGTNLFHLVALTGGGWVAMPADDATAPVFAVNLSSALPEKDDGAPGWYAFALTCGFAPVERGVRPRFDVTATSVAPAASRQLLAASAPCESRTLSWASLDGDTANGAAWRRQSGESRAKRVNLASTALGSLSDERVSSFIASRWSQLGVATGDCYNYYTPYVTDGSGNTFRAYCGCVATAMAQTMRYFNYPKAPPHPDREYTIYVVRPGDESQSDAQTVKMLPGDFDWDNMAYFPEGGEWDRTEVEREAIGRLTYNCGLAVRMHYGFTGSYNTFGIEEHRTYVTEFGYGGCDWWNCRSFDDFARTVLPNLDARRPVTANIPGHEVVCDGYGFSEGALFLHVNMGWGGWEDLYYRQLDGADSGRVIGNVVFNLSTEGTVRIASGRVTDANGNPLAGKTVTARIRRTGGSEVETRTLTTDEKGIYAVEVTDAGYAVELSAFQPGLLSEPATRTAVTTSAADGNSWGNDFTLRSTDAWIEESAQTPSVTGAWSREVVYGADGWAEVEGACAFTPYAASTGNVVTVEVKAYLIAPTFETATDGDGQASVRLGPNGSFQVWTRGDGEGVQANRWLDVANPGLAPENGRDYTLRLVMHYVPQLYTASVVESGTTYPLADATGRAEFPLATAATAVSKVAFDGGVLFSSIQGRDVRIEGFGPGDLELLDAKVVLDAAQAQWLDRLGSHAAVSGRIASLTAEQFGTAWLCNLDLMRDGCAATLAITGITVREDQVEIAVMLQRTHAVRQGGRDAPINGVLKFYGAQDLASFVNRTATPAASSVIDNKQFGSGEEATVAFPRGDARMFKAVIE